MNVPVHLGPSPMSRERMSKKRGLPWRENGRRNEGCRKGALLFDGRHNAQVVVEEARGIEQNEGAIREDVL